MCVHVCVWLLMILDKLSDIILWAAFIQLVQCFFTILLVWVLGLKVMRLRPNAGVSTHMLMYPVTLFSHSNKVLGFIPAPASLCGVCVFPSLAAWYYAPVFLTPSLGDSNNAHQKQERISFTLTSTSQTVHYVTEPETGFLLVSLLSRIILCMYSHSPHTPFSLKSFF